MIPNHLQVALKLIAQKLNRANIQWAIIGSANLALQGMSIKPRDIDVLINNLDKEKTIDLFGELKNQPIKKHPGGGYEEVECTIKEAAVQFCFEYQNGIYFGGLDNNNLTYKNLDGEKIPCFKLKNEAEAYNYLGREKTAQIIKKYLESKCLK